MIAILKSSIAVITGKYVPLWLYAALFILSILTAGFYADYFEDTEDDLTSLMLSVTMGILIMLLVLYWLLTRLMGQAEKKGSVLLWLGWLLPVAGFYAVAYTIWLLLPINVDEMPWPLYWVSDAAISAFSFALCAPFFVVSTGRVLDAKGPPASQILGATRRYYWPLFALNFLIYLIGGFFSGALSSNFGQVAGSDMQAFGISAIGGVFDFATALLATAITVVVYREIEATLPGST